VQQYFAALDEKRFLLSDTVQNLPVVRDRHVRTLSRIINVLQLLDLDLCEPLQILCFFILPAILCFFIHSALCMQPHTTSQSE